MAHTDGEKKSIFNELTNKKARIKLTNEVFVLKLLFFLYYKFNSSWNAKSEMMSAPQFRIGLT